MTLPCRAGAQIPAGQLAVRGLAAELHDDLLDKLICYSRTTSPTILCCCDGTLDELLHGVGGIVIPFCLHGDLSQAVRLSHTASVQHMHVSIGESMTEQRSV